MILARGVGRGAHAGVQQSDLHPFVTDIPEIEAAVQAAIRSEIMDHTEKLH